MCMHGHTHKLLTKTRSDFISQDAWRVIRTSPEILMSDSSYDCSSSTEPTRFGHLPNTTAIDPQQLADDFHSLSELLTSLSKMEHFVSGPDISKPDLNVSEFSTHMQYLQRYVIVNGISMQLCHSVLAP